jgi:hypothetical protein
MTPDDERRTGYCILCSYLQRRPVARVVLWLLCEAEVHLFFMHERVSLRKELYLADMKNSQALLT